MATTGSLALLGIATAATPALADVAVTPGEAVQGGGADLTLRITNESPTASVTAVDVQLPADTPIAEVYPLSVADWAPSMTYRTIDKPVPSLHGYQVTDVTTAIRWVAMPDRALPPGGKTELFLSIGPLPAVATLSLAVVLTNSDGSQVRWTGAPGTATTAGEHPAPAIALKAAPAGQGAHGAEHGGAAAADAADIDAAADPAAGGGTSYGGWAMATLLAIAVITIVGLLVQRRKVFPPDSPEPDSTDATDSIEDEQPVPAASGVAP